jgi:hypothetical protein
MTDSDIPTNKLCVISLDGPSAFHSALYEDGKLDEHIARHHPEEEYPRIYTREYITEYFGPLTVDNIRDFYRVIIESSEIDVMIGATYAEFLLAEIASLESKLREAAAHFAAYDTCPMCHPLPAREADTGHGSEWRRGRQLHRDGCWVAALQDAKGK